MTREYRNDWKEDALDELAQQQGGFLYNAPAEIDDPGWWPDDKDDPQNDRQEHWYPVEVEEGPSPSRLTPSHLSQGERQEGFPPDSPAAVGNDLVSFPDEGEGAAWSDTGSLPAYPASHDYDDEQERIDVFTLRSLMAETFVKPYCVVDGLLPPGLALLASPPKYGKSWMALDLCLSVVDELPFLGYRTNKAHCLYLALEDSKARLQERAAKLLGNRPVPHGLELAIHAPDLSGGLYQQLNEAFNNNPFLKLVVIDTLQKVRGRAVGREGAYQYDYREMSALKGLADAFNATILLVHHLNKVGDDSDPHNRINGTTGILGAADTSIVLTKSKRYDDVATMSVTGRDIESCELSIRFDPELCRWVEAKEEMEQRQRQKEAYDSSPITETIRSLVAAGGRWKGNVTSLMTAGREQTGFELASSPKQMGKILRDGFIELLKENDGIQTVIHSLGTGGKVYEFIKGG